MDVKTAATQTRALDLRGFAPGKVEAPGSAEDVARLVAEAVSGSRTILPAGHGTALSYLGRPERCDLALRLDGVSGVTAFNPGDLTVTARAGTALRDLAGEIADEHLWLPGASTGDGTLGGLLACAHTSPLGGEINGTTRERLLGLQVAGVDGKLTRSGGRVVKNVAGYDMHRFHPGTGGAFGILTEATLRLEPKPEASRLVRLSSEHASSISDAWTWLRRQGPDVAAVWINLWGSPSFTMEALLLGDYEQVDDVMNALETGWGRWGEIARLAADESAIPQPIWQDAAKDLAFSLRARPTRVLALLPLVSDWPAAVGLVHRLIAYPNLGQIKLSVTGDPGPMVELWDRIARAARSGEFSYRVENEPPALSTDLPRWSAEPSLLRLVARLKQSLDPEGCLRPGSYSAEALERSARYFQGSGEPAR
jgi:glycolate oxidase FAD binding subunit